MEIGKKENPNFKNYYLFFLIDPDDPPLDKLSLNNIHHPYRTIGCLFNDKLFYANIQV
jgi:hypothetical protein